MTDKQIIALWLYNRRSKRQQKNHNMIKYYMIKYDKYNLNIIFLVQPINARREEVGLFYNYLMTYEMIKINFLVISLCQVLLFMYYM
jgi:hypothetical protein